MSVQVNPSNLQFLKELSEHNEREWFNENKERYEAAHKNTIAVADGLLAKLSAHDQITTASGKKSLMRVYRDVRFSKDKSPYNPRWAGSFARQKPELRGGYFFSIKPGESVVGGGFYGPNPSDLKLIRDHIAQDDQPLRDVLESSDFKKVFGHIQGDQVKSAPKGFAKDHPSIDLLRYKSIYAFRNFSDEEVMSVDFTDRAVEVFLSLRPFFDVMTEFLTTDMNGISLIEY